jgi:hypothetical protein
MFNTAQPYMSFNDGAAGQRAQAQASLLGALYSQPGQFAGAAGQAFGGMAQGLGNVAGAMADERTGWYGANAMAEAARQNAASNIGAGALSAFGGASNNAMQAWAANQAAYQKSEADIQAANQMARSQYATGRNNNLAALAGAGVLSGMNAPGSGFSATGVSGPISSGSFGGSSSPGGSMSFLNTLRRDILSGDGGISAQADSGRDQLDSAYYSSRYAPQQMLSQTLGGLHSLAGRGLGASQMGMNQFYATQNNPANRAQFGGVLNQLNSGYSGALGQMNKYGQMMQGAMGKLHDAFGITGPQAPRKAWRPGTPASVIASGRGFIGDMG